MAIKSPFGLPDSFIVAVTGTTAFTIINNSVLMDGATVQLTGNATINLTIDKNLIVGAKILLKSATVGVTTLTFGTGFICPILTGVAGKTFVTEFYFDGTNFLPTGAPYQIN